MKCPVCTAADLVKSERSGVEYNRYTCYGCHERSPEKIRREHFEEGIRDFKNCIECHRSADERDIRMPGRRGEGEKGRGRERDDD